MKFVSIRLVTADVDGLAAFYSMVTGVEALRPAPVFAEIRGEAATLAICHESIIRQFNAGAAIAASNRSVIIEFEVDDVDALGRRLQDSGVDIVMPPADMPWGNRSMLLRDPDGNIINIFARGLAQT